MKRLSSVLLLVVALNAAAQKAEPVLLSVGDENITKSEFEKIYRKNNKNTAHDIKSLEEYMELFVNYRLKVKEAKEEKLDTALAFRQELEGYRKQLAQPYLSDKQVTDKLLTEAYQHCQQDIRASHLMIKLSPDAMPKDTLEAYKKAMALRDKIVKGESFEAVAKANSEDPSVKDNGGDLGYFTCFQMVYPFESAVYAGKVNEVSWPVRTRYGYHLIKITERRPAQGQMRAAHIMVKANSNSSTEEQAKAKQKIDEIYQKLKAGEKFEDLAKTYSDDASSARSGGALPWFGTGKMVGEFEVAAFALQKDGDYSEPIKTPYGWHIIKRLEKKNIPDYNTMLPDLKTRVSKDSRSELSKSSMVNRIKAEYKFKEYPKAVNEFVNIAGDSSIIDALWTIDHAKGLNKVLFTLNAKNYTGQDFAQYILSHQTSRKDIGPRAATYSLYKDFVDESAMAYEESRLELKYPEFNALMQEYRDGIMLFELTDKKVWSKAVKDSSGLKAFYERNKNNYMWPMRVDAVIYSASSLEMAKKARDLSNNPKIDTDSLLSVINKGSQLNLSVKDGKYARGENEIVDMVNWKTGNSDFVNKGNQVHFVKIKEVLNPQAKSLDEARGMVTADYQAELEKNWIARLRTKYKYTVNKEVLKSMVQ